MIDKSKMIIPARLLVGTLCLGMIGCGGTMKPEASGTTNGALKSAGVPESGGADAVAAPEISLTEAVAEGDAKAVKQHILAGTDLNPRAPETNATPLIAAATLGYEVTAILLIEAGADLEARNNEGSTALHIAAFLCREDTVKALLANGADRDALNNAGATALDSVKGPFAEVKPIYDLLLQMLGPYGLELDYAHLERKRPEMAQLLEQ